MDKDALGMDPNGGAGGSFSSLRAYGRALAQTPRRLARRACAATAPGEEMSRVRARSGAHMARALRWPDLVGLGLGGMVGAGVFVTTGRATRLYAGPGVVVSYAIAGLCALLSAFCYTEFAVDMPVAGGAFSYLRVTFGEFAAFLTGANLIMEYVFSNAAVSRSFTAYLGTAVGVDAPSKWRLVVPGLPKGFNEVDLVAVGVILLISVCICYSTKESSVVNMALTAVHVAFILFIIVMGFWRGDARNLTRPADPAHPGGFFPHGVGGVFNGAAMVYLSYIGYDAVSTMAEEVERPARDIPVGVWGSVVLVTALYCLMAASMSMLLPYDAIDTEAPFSGAFKGSEGWGWVSNVIGAGASLGILTSLMVAMLGQARYLCVIGRSGVMPAWLAKVHPKTATPVNASAFLVHHLPPRALWYTDVFQASSRRRSRSSRSWTCSSTSSPSARSSSSTWCPTPSCTAATWPPATAAGFAPRPGRRSPSSSPSPSSRSPSRCCGSLHPAAASRSGSWGRAQRGRWPRSARSRLSCRRRTSPSCGACPACRGCQRRPCSSTSSCSGRWTGRPTSGSGSSRPPPCWSTCSTACTPATTPRRTAARSTAPRSKTKAARSSSTALGAGWLT